MLELKVPPPVQLLLAGLLAWGASLTSPQWSFRLPFGLWIFACCAVTGVGITAAGVIVCRRHATTISPLSPHNATALVRDGVYRYSRNPMYLGMLLVLVGFVLWLAHPLAVAAVPVFVASITRLQIRPEERVLRELFGTEYDTFVREVRRWV
jgi:protein-S-isoprenylcysteine O-methyltransferase Ste14